MASAARFAATTPILFSQPQCRRPFLLAVPLALLNQSLSKSHSIPALQIGVAPLPLVGRRLTFHPSLLFPPKSSTDAFSDLSEEELAVESILTEENKPVKTVLWVLFWASLSLALFAFSKDAKAAADSIRASGFGVKVASALRSSGWPDEAIVFALAALPVIELRGAIPVGYWMQLNPTVLTAISVLGNMVPVPFILLYLRKLANYLVSKNSSASLLLERLLKRAKEQAGPVEEFQGLGLMLFVAVPFPGTGAWSGAIIASVLDMPFWSGLWANFSGVVIAGLLLNLLVNLGLKQAVLAGIVLFVVSTIMWNILRSFRKPLSSTS